MKSSVKILPDIRSMRDVKDTRVDLLGNAIQQPRLEHTVTSAPDFEILIFLRRFYDRSIQET